MDPVCEHLQPMERRRRERPEKDADFNGGYLVQRIKARNVTEEDAAAVLQRVATGQDTIKEAVKNLKPETTSSEIDKRVT